MYICIGRYINKAFQVLNAIFHKFQSQKDQADAHNRQENVVILFAEQRSESAYSYHGHDQDLHVETKSKESDQCFHKD